MTDWPDDWFRGGSEHPDQDNAADGLPAATPGDDAPGPRGRQARSPSSGPAGPGEAGRDESPPADPTMRLPVRRPGQGPAVPLGAQHASRPADRASAPRARQTPAAQRARAQNGARQAARAQARTGQPGPSRSSAASGWPEQPSRYTTNRTAGGSGTPPPRPGYRSGSGGIRRPPHWRRWLRPKPILAAIAAIICLAVLGGIVSYFSLDSQLVKRNVLADYPSRPVQGSGQNWLITGSDSRQGLTKSQMRHLATGYNVSGQRSDTIMVLHLPASGRPVLISLPRDSYVPIPGHGYNKINAAYAIGGPALLARTVQNVTRLRIDHYMGIGFGGFVRVVNAVGGVRICLKTPLVDPAAGLHLHKGCQTLNGAKSLGFVRSRHLYATQDLQRIQNQRIFLSALLRKLTSTSVIIDPFRSYPAASDVAGSLTVDNGTSLYQLAQVAFALRNPITTTVPIGNTNYLTQNAGDALLWNAKAAKRLFAALNDGTPIPKGLITGSQQAG